MISVINDPSHDVPYANILSLLKKTNRIFKKIRKEDRNLFQNFYLDRSVLRIYFRSIQIT